MLKNKICMFCSTVAVIWLLTSPGLVDAQLVLDTQTYQHVVEAVHTVFNNTCVIFMYTVENPMQALNPHDSEQLMSLLAYIGRLHVRTFAYAIKTFKEFIGDGYFNLKRPLFILINDSEDLRKQYSEIIAPWISMAYINWVIFFRDETRIDDFFSDIYVPLDCIFLIVKKSKDGNSYTLSEVYQISKGRELIIDEFGNWNEDDGLTTTRYALYQRRSDLRGQLIRVSSVEDPPVSMIQKDATGQMVGIKGFFGTIIQILVENLNCTITYTESDSWGARLPDGSWSGIMGLLVRKEIDLAATELLMTGDRLDAVEFSTPVFSTKCRTFIKRPYYAAIKWTAYSDPFYGGIWLSLLIVVMISSAFVLIGLKNTPRWRLDRKEEITSGFLDTFFHIFGSLCGQGHESGVTDSLRTINLVVHLTGVVILAAYSAALISFLAIKVFVMPFTTMEGLLEDKSYKVGVVRDSADLGFFKDTSDRTLRRMYEEIFDDVEKLPNNYLEGLTDLCTREAYAFMTTDNMFAILEHQIPCTLVSLDTIMQTTAAMAVPKRSPFRGIINSNILMMRDSGVLQRVVANELVVQAVKELNGWSTVEIVDVLPLLLLILCGSAVGLMILCCEKVQHTKSLGAIESSIFKRLRKPIVVGK